METLKELIVNEYENCENKAQFLIVVLKLIDEYNQIQKISLDDTSIDYDSLYDNSGSAIHSIPKNYRYVTNTTKLNIF